MKVIPALPRRQDSKKEISYTQDSILVEKLEELVDLSIQEITQPLDQLRPESPTTQIFPHSPPQYPPRVMVADVNQPAWRAIQHQHHPTPSPSWVIQLDMFDVKVIGDMKDVLIRLFADPRVCQFIDIMVVDIPEAYGLILRRDWSMKLNGYFATDLSHMWQSYKNSQNNIKILREPHMKQNINQLEEKNEPINFSSSVLGNYFLDLEPENYQAEEVICESDT